MQPVITILFFVVALFGARTAGADEEPAAARRVIHFSGAKADESTARRVRAELRTDFEVVDVEPPAQGSDIDDWAARQLADPKVLAAALIRVEPGTGASIEWWHRQPDGSVVRRSIVESDPTPEGAELLALRVAELAAAASVTPDAEPEPVGDPPEPSPERAAPRPPRWRASVGVGPLWSPGGLGVMLQPVAAASLAIGPTRHFGVGADASVTAVPGRVDLDGLRRRIGVARVGLNAIGWLAPQRRVSASLALGAGVGVGWSGPTPRRQTAVATASIAPALHVALSSRVGIEVGVRGAMALPRFEVASGEQQLATAGQPFLDAWLGVQFRG